MKGALPLSALVLGAALLGGCQDNSAEVDKLHKQLVAQQTKLDESNDRSASERDALRAEIEALKKQLGTLNAKDGKPIADRIAELEKRAAETPTEPNADIATRLDKIDEKLTSVEAKADTATSKADAAQQTATEAKENQNAAGTTAPTIEETKNLADALNNLEISQAEKDQVRQAIIDAKQQILETLEVPTADGRNLAEELIDTMIKIQNGDAKQSDAMVLFMDLAKQKVPGDINDRTYMDAINDIKARNKEDIGRILTVDDQKKLSKAHDDWTDFEVGDGDPFGELYMERVQKYQQDHPTKED